jgi:hypothetical protein
MQEPGQLRLDYGLAHVYAGNVTSGARTACPGTALGDDTRT